MKSGGEAGQYMVVQWLNPRASFKVSSQVKAMVQNPQYADTVPGRNSFSTAMMNAYPLAKVDYDWNPNDAVELGIRKGIDNIFIVYALKN